MKIWILSPLLLSGTLILLSCSRNTTSPGGVRVKTSSESTTRGTSVNNTSLEAAILDNINAHRRSMGLSSLQMITAANQQAYNHSRNMATGKTPFSHNGFSQRISIIQQSIGGSSASAENVAYGSLSAKEVVKVWLNSPPHRKNIEGNYTLTGIGTYKDREGTLYFTQIFLRK